MVYLASLFLLLCLVLICMFQYLYLIILHLSGFDLPLILLFLLKFNNFFPGWLDFQLFSMRFLFFPLTILISYLKGKAKY